MEEGKWARLGLWNTIWKRYSDVANAAKRSRASYAGTLSGVSAIGVEEQNEATTPRPRSQHDTLREVEAHRNE